MWADKIHIGNQQKSDHKLLTKTLHYVALHRFYQENNERDMLA